MTRYIYRKRSLRFLARSFDIVCGSLCRLCQRASSRLGPSIRDVPENPHIALIRLDGIGDVMAALPAARALRKRFPEGRLTMIVRDPAVELLDGLPFVDEALGVDFDLYSHQTRLLHSLRCAARLRRMLLKGRYDVAIEPRGDPRIIAALWASGVPMRIGVRSAGAGFLLNSAADYARDIPEAEHNLAVIAALAPDAKLERVRLVPDPEAVEMLFARHTELHKPFFAVHPSASMQTKVWPAERFAEVIEGVSEKWGLLPVIVGGNDARGPAEEIAARIGSDQLNLVGKTTLKQLVALLSRASLFVGNDSGPGQLAAYSGCPTVMVFSGTNDPHVWRPPGDNVAAISHHVECSPCERRHCDDPKCLLQVTVDDVLRGIETVLAS